MTAFPTLPRLELDISDMDSPFDEAVLLINGHEEETIRIECNGSDELAERLMRYVNAHAQVVEALTAAAHALRSYEHGNASTELARDIAAHCDTARAKMGAAA